MLFGFFQKLKRTNAWILSCGMHVLVLLFHCQRSVVEWCIFLKATVSRLPFFLELQIATKLDISIAEFVWVLILSTTWVLCGPEFHILRYSCQILNGSTRIKAPSVFFLKNRWTYKYLPQVAASTNKEMEAQIPNYPSLPPQLICQLHNVTMHVSLELYSTSVPK